MMDIIISSIVAVIVVILGSFLTLKQIRANALLNEKIKWIEDLRELISEYITLLNELRTAFDDLKTKVVELNKSRIPESDLLDKATALAEPVKRESRLLNKTKHKIMLYLSDDDEHKKLVELIKSLYEDSYVEIPKLLEGFIPVDQKIIDTKTDELIQECRSQFKKERDKVKPS